MNQIMMSSKHRRDGRYAVYIVECTDGTYYTGSTNNVESRLRRHNSGKGAKCLRGKRPVTLVYAKAYGSSRSALRAEAHLKKQTRTYKEALIGRDKSCVPGIRKKRSCD